jgi:hypothetical protein
LAKKLQFNFTNKVVKLQLDQNLPKYVPHSPNTICQTPFAIHNLPNTICQTPFAKKASDILCTKNLHAIFDEIAPRSKKKNLTFFFQKTPDTRRGGRGQNFEIFFVSKMIVLLLKELTHVV